MVIGKGVKTPSVVQVESSATEIAASRNTRRAILIHNSGDETVYLGSDDSVTTESGIPLVSGFSLEDAATWDSWWGITESGTADVRVIEVVR